MNYIMALDQGTTSSRAIIFDQNGGIAASAQKDFRQIFPQAGWVEHDPYDILASQLDVMKEAHAKSGLAPTQIKAIGVTNQRETTLLWEKSTGKPVYNAIVWQCRRTAPLCEELKESGIEVYVKEKTGLVVDAYFSATKIKWILDNVSGARQMAENGELMFGTVDTWLIYNLTGGKVHATDYTNASRTMLFDIDRLEWDEALLKALGIPRAILPEVHPSGHIFGYTDILGNPVPVAASAGDQHAALFGQMCFEPGDVKNTYGTGCFLLMNTGKTRYNSSHGMITTLAAGIGKEINYVVEGSVFSAGTVIQWLRDELGLIKSAAESEQLALSVADNGGVYFVPAFTGLGAPYWDMYARGSIFGLTRGASKAHLVRAGLESIAFQSADLATAVCADTGIKINSLCVDGGASANNFLMQFQADILKTNIVRPKIVESTAYGAALLAGLAVGIYSDISHLKQVKHIDRIFSPSMPEARADELKHEWQRAVSGALHWAK